VDHHADAWRQLRGRCLRQSRHRGWNRNAHFRLILAVNDIPPVPQHGQLMATRMLCFCSSSRSVRSSIFIACCANSSCSDKPLDWIWSSSAAGGDELLKESAGGGGADVA